LEDVDREVDRIIRKLKAREYYRKNRDKIKAYHRFWRANNPDKEKLYAEKVSWRRTGEVIKAIKDSDEPLIEVVSRFKRVKSRCVLCGKFFTGKYPKRAVGLDKEVISQLREFRLCRECFMKVFNRAFNDCDYKAYDNGEIVSRFSRVLVDCIQKNKRG